jgi:hypothetical protein
MIDAPFAPSARAASTYSFSRCESVCAPRDAGVGDPLADPQDEDEVEDPRPQHDQEHDREQDERERQLDVGDAHDERVEAAAEVAPKDAERGPERAADDHRGEADEQRDACAVDQARQHVSAQRVGAERELHDTGPVRCHRRLQAGDDVLAVRVLGGDARTRHRGHRDQQQHDDRQERPHLAHQAAPGACRGARRRLGRAGGGRRGRGHESLTRGSRRA